MATRTPLVFRDNNVTGTPSPGDNLDPRFLQPGVLPHLLFPGKWYAPSSIDGQMTNVGLGLMRAVYDLFYIPKPVRVSSIGIDIFQASPSGTAEMGVYSPDPTTGFPGALLFSRTFTDLTATGIAEIVGVDFTLSEGWYFTGAAANVGANPFQIQGVIRSHQMFAKTSTLFSVTGVTTLANNPTIDQALNSTTLAATPIFKFAAA